MKLYQSKAKKLINIKYMYVLKNLEHILLVLEQHKGDKMSFQISKANDLMAKALDYRSARQGLIAGNIANVDTPFYRPRDISFTSTLQAEARKVFNEPEVPTLELAQTNGAHFKSALESDAGQAQLFYRGGHLARNDGNSVDLDVETTELTKNSMMFQGIIAAMKKDSSMFKAVIEASRQTS